MDHIIETIARRLERAADRMTNAGEHSAAQRFRQAAIAVRRQCDLTRAMDLEERLISRTTNADVRLHPFAGSTEYDASTTADPVTAATGQAIAQTAATVMADYKARNVKYNLGSDASDGGALSDCNHFVMDVLDHAGFSGLNDFTTTSIGNDPQFVKVPAGQQQPGDVIVTSPTAGSQHGHMGVYSGTDAQGRPTGYQMGTTGGPAKIPWTATTTPGTISYYRPRQ